MILNFLNSNLTFNFLIIILFFMFKALKVLNFREQLKLQYITLVLAFAAVITQPLIPKHTYMIPALKVWNAHSVELKDLPLKAETSYITLSSEISAPRIETSQAFQVLGVLMLLALIWGLGKIVQELLVLKNLESHSLLIRKKNKIQIFVSERVEVPFSYMRPGKLITMLPTHLINYPGDFKAALYHEFQHHRQGDTFWAYPLLLLKSLCGLNPFAYWLVDHIQETQEFACDEALLNVKQIDTHSYISCLVRVAQSTVESKAEPVCATGFCFNRQQNILKRRIEKMNGGKMIPTKRSLLTFILVSMVSLLALSAWASRNIVQDKHLTMEEAQNLVKNHDDFPLIVNEEVLTQLNKYLGTPEGRSFIKDSLERKSAFQEMLKQKSKAYGTPDELNAIPIVESGFVNRSTTGRIKAAGIWMFIPATARKYGMKVNGKIDERMNVEMETDAAQRYLLSNQLRFKDWHLALLAYNIGEGTVQKGIEKFKTRNAWELLAKGVEGDKNYLPSVMAAMIIMKNPDLLKN